MIARSAFDDPQVLADGRIVRRIRFVPQSTLPLAAACLVANGVRETLARLLASEVDVDLVEPALPGAAERRLLVLDAAIVRVRGRLCDGFVIVRPADARRLVGLAFGEGERPDREPLSEIERATLDRMVTALVPLCNTLCGTLGPAVRESPERAACDVATYFEVRTTGTVRLSIGFALTRDPAEEVGEPIALAELAEVELDGRVEFARGRLSVPTFSRLAVGATIALETPLSAAGTLRFGDVAFARGACGVAGGRGAFVVDGVSGAGA